VVNKVLKFVNDAKLIGMVANQLDIERLQKDLKNLCPWARHWLLLFNVEKCKVMHVGYNSRRISYEM
jgi:hypothetical protein